MYVHKPSELAIFLLLGGENMSSYGVYTPWAQKSQENILLFGNDYKWRYAQEPTDDPTQQIDVVSIDPLAGYSLGKSFAKRFLTYSPKEIVGLVPCAKSNSTISDWQKASGRNTLYGSALFRAKETQDKQYGTIKGLLFYQGEADALLSATPTWNTQFTQLIADIRADLSLPNLPVVFAQIGDNTISPTPSNWTTIQSQQAGISITKVSMVTTTGLKLQDTYHLTPKSQIAVGKKMADAMDVIL